MQGITPLNDFQVAVAAKNLVGYGPPSDPALITAITQPQPVVNLTALPSLGPRRIKVSWATPEDIGRGPMLFNLDNRLTYYYRVVITNASLPISPVGFATVERCFTKTGEACACGLTQCEDSEAVNRTQLEAVFSDVAFEKGVQYRFDVYVHNDAMQSEPASAFSCAIERPDAPRLPRAIGSGDASIRVSWLPPVDTGAGVDNACAGSDESQLLLYLVQVSQRNPFVPLAFPGLQYGDIMLVGAQSNSFLRDSLVKAQRYYFKVYAENLAGTSLSSTIVDAVAATPAQPPENVHTAIAGPQSVRVSWELPADLGLGDNANVSISRFVLQASPIQSYGQNVIERYASPANLFYTFEDLQAGVMYGFSVSIETSAGGGIFADPVFERVVNFPSAPAGTFVFPSGEEELTLRWNIPADQGIGSELVYPIT
eukprot:3396454-Rhodomonas_salina.1